MSEATAVMPATPPVAVAWGQFNPWRSPEKEKKQQGPRSVNTITIFMAAKKIMAREWRRARGIKRRDPRATELEKCAGEYKARRVEREQERRRKVIRMKEKRDKILECLDLFVHSILDKRQPKRITSLAQVGELMAEAFTSLGEVIDVEWTDGGGCHIWIEPWPERRARRARGDVRPALHRVSLDARLNISAYEPVTDPAVWEEKRKDLLLRPLRLGINEIRKLRTAQEAQDLLAEKAWEVGRVLNIRSEKGSWKIRIQPWDEVRQRNLNRSSKGPITEYELTVSKDLQDLSCKRVEDKTCP